LFDQEMLSLFASLRKKLGINLQAKFFDWCMRVGDWKKEGLFHEQYFVDGKPKFSHYQLDQTASVL